jgi:transcriptional regulator with XRE-family HTH domain
MAPTPNPHLWDGVWYLRQRLGWSVEHLGRLAGVSPAAIMAYEEGGELSPTDLLRIADALAAEIGANPVDLFSEFAVVQT